MSHKFTADGKKVAIIGALNATETIVQEVYVTDGTEFPAGEHFVVKTLLNAPAETYKAKEERRILEDIEKHKAVLTKLQNEITDFRYKAAAAAAKIRWIEGIKELEIQAVFDNLKSMLCGEYTHVVLPSSQIEIMEWDHKLFTACDDYRRDMFENLKMISLFGHWNGRLGMDWRVNGYSDGSGSSRQFIPCKSLQEAIEASKAIIEAKTNLSDHDFKFCVKYGIPVDATKNAARLAAKAEYIKGRISDQKKAVEKLEAELSSIS